SHCRCERVLPPRDWELAKFSYGRTGKSHAHHSWLIESSTLTLPSSTSRRGWSRSTTQSCIRRRHVNVNPPQFRHDLLSEQFHALLRIFARRVTDGEVCDHQAETHFLCVILQPLPDRLRTSHHDVARFIDLFPSR